MTASDPSKPKQTRPADVRAARPVDARRALLGAFEKAANQLRLKARGELLLARDDWRPVKAGIIAAQLVARVLGCSSEKATEHCERAMNSGSGVVSGQESSLESQLVNLAAWVGAFHHLTVKGGHLPAAVLRAIAKDLQLDHANLPASTPAGCSAFVVRALVASRQELEPQEHSGSGSQGGHGRCLPPGALDSPTLEFWVDAGDGVPQKLSTIPEPDDLDPQFNPDDGTTALLATNAADPADAVNTTNNLSHAL